MSEVFVGYGDSASDTATLVLAAAEKAGLPADSVRSVEGGFYVDEKIAKSAGVDYLSDDEIQAEQVARQAPNSSDNPPARDEPDKASAKAEKKAPRKAAPRKTAAKKAAPRKSASRRK